MVVSVSDPVVTLNDLMVVSASAVILLLSELAVRLGLVRDI